jgi:hypothetical protein
MLKCVIRGKFLIKNNMEHYMIDAATRLQGVASPFNIVTESLTLKNFTKEEIAQLYRQLA